MHIDIMSIPMTKQKETSQFVWYKFEITIVDASKKPDISYHYGVFKFNKNSNYKKDSLNNMIEIIKKETDQILWDNQKILIKCLVKMIECQKQKSYPNKVHYACG